MSNKNDKVYLFAGGGSGGHLFPGNAVARALIAKEPNAVVKFLATDRAIDKDIMQANGYKFISQPVVPMQRSPFTWFDFYNRYRKSVAMCKALIEGENVVAILGLGGYASVPAMKAAHDLDVPVAMLNPDSIPGKANKYSMKYADKICVQWASAMDHFGKDKDKCIVTGCPIRETIMHGNKQEALKTLGIDRDKKTLVITGGSLGGHNVNCAVIHCIIDQHGIDAFDQWQVVHVTGKHDYQWVKQQYGIVSFKSKVIPFHNNMEDVLAVADLVISRAGASILAEISALGIPSILIPYPYHKDQHQLINANILGTVGGAKVVPDCCDVEKTATHLGQELKILMADDTLRNEMSRNCLDLAKTNGATLVAEALIALANEGWTEI